MILEGTQALLGKDQIFAADDLRREDVDVPEWGGRLRLQCMSGTQRVRWDTEVAGMRDLEGGAYHSKLRMLQALAIVLSAIDAEGKPAFAEDDIERLLAKNPTVLERVANRALMLSALKEESVDELGKPSAPAPSDASSSGLPES